MRCYNGCPDSALQEKLDHDAHLRQQLADKGMRLCYYPAEGKWLVYRMQDYQDLTGFHDTMEQAAQIALEDEE